MRRLAPLTVTLALTLACSPGGVTTDDDTGTTGDDTSTSTGDGDGDGGASLCDPSDANACGGAAGVMCCSDDPAALELANLDAFVTPAYIGRGGEGTPVFSGDNNPLSRSGLCVAEGSVPAADALTEANAQGCPVPCNPTWSDADITSVCGSARICCQTRPLEPEDCAFDPNLGEAGCWRPVTGNDIQGLGGIDASNWASDSHATHQDPSGTNCQIFALGIPPDVLAAEGLTGSDVLEACYRRLGVANRRGVCTTAGEACPYAGPDYVDACEQLNLDDGREGC